MSCPARLIWLMFPLQATNDCRPLPHVAGSPDLRVLRVDPTPPQPSTALPSRSRRLPVQAGAVRASQVPDASLRECRALKTPPGRFDTSPLTVTIVSASTAVTVSPPGATPVAGRIRAFGAVARLQGAATPLRPTRCSVYASPSSFGSLLLRKCNTRYGWVATPYPVGTRTRQEAPGFAWRTTVTWISGETRREATSFVRCIRLVRRRIAHGHL